MNPLPKALLPSAIALTEIADAAPAEINALPTGTIAGSGQVWSSNLKASEKPGLE